jgi:DNA (cytosine-5)-methyltransferase 1
MGFDRPGEQPFAIPVSDTQAYKQFGNAVVVPVV